MPRPLIVARPSHRCFVSSCLGLVCLGLVSPTTWLGFLDQLPRALAWFPWPSTSCHGLVSPCLGFEAPRALAWYLGRGPRAMAWYHRAPSRNSSIHASKRRPEPRNRKSLPDPPNARSGSIVQSFAQNKVRLVRLLTNKHGSKAVPKRSSPAPGNSRPRKPKVSVRIILIHVHGAPRKVSSKTESGWSRF